MADPQTDPHDDTVTSVPLPTDDGERVVEQENVNPEIALGGGGWPSLHEPSVDPAPGAEAATPAEPPPSRNGFPPMKDVLDAEPATGGSGSIPDDDDDDAGGPRPAWPRQAPA